MKRKTTIQGDITGVAIAENSTINQTIIQNMEFEVPKQLSSKLGKESIIGREKELKEIDELLNSSNKTLLINGIGGVGKSTMASYYLHSKKEELDYYGFFEDLGDFVAELEMSFNLQNDENKKGLSTVLFQLRQLKGEKLLVIDDIKKIDKNREAIEQILELRHSGYTILLTSREEINFVESYYLDMLSMKDAKKLFNSIYSIEDEVLFEEILELLDCHALFVELTAKTLQNRKSLTPLKIKKMFESGKFANVNIKIGEIFNTYLKKLFKFSTLNRAEKEILRKLTILPSIELSFEYLEKILKTHFPLMPFYRVVPYLIDYLIRIPFENLSPTERVEFNLNSLVEKGWLSKTDNGYKSHQIIKEYILSNYPPDIMEVSLTVDLIQAEIDNNIFDEKSLIKNLIYMEAKILFFIKAMSTKKEKIDYYNSLGFLYYEQGLYGKAKSSYFNAIEILKNLNKEYPKIANSYNGLGEIAYLNRNFDKAEEYHFIALDIQKKSLKNMNHFDVSRTYLGLAKIHKNKEEYQLSESYYLQALDIEINKLGESHLRTISTYRELAEFYQLNNKYDIVEKIHMKVLDVRIKTFGKTHLHTAMSYMDLALFYFDSNSFEKAKVFMEIGLEIFKKNLSLHHEWIINAEKYLKTIEFKIDESKKQNNL